MKTTIKIYLEPEDLAKLIRKAQEAGFCGRGSLSRYIEKLAREPICFLDSNLKTLLNSLGNIKNPA